MITKQNLTDRAEQIRKEYSSILLEIQKLNTDLQDLHNKKSYLEGAFNEIEILLSKFED